MTERYRDQFTPWAPNNFVDDFICVPADTLGGAIVGHTKQKDQQGLTQTCNLLYSAISVNFYLEIFSKNSTKKEV